MLVHLADLKTCGALSLDTLSNFERKMCLVSSSDTWTFATKHKVTHHAAARKLLYSVHQLKT
jgi:hypothetical protein